MKIEEFHCKDIVYASRTGNVRRFVRKLNYSFCYEIQRPISKRERSYFLITYTAGFGEVPIEVEEFLSLNHSNLRGVIGSGNRNWGSNYCRSAYILSERYRVPLLMTFEMSGTGKDVIKLQEILEKQDLTF